MSVSRRTLLYTAAATAGGLVASPNILRGAPPSPANGAIDVHCHFFNASDLPIDGFVTLAVAEQYYGERDLLFPGAVVETVSKTLKDMAPSADEEMRGRCPGSVGLMVARPAVTDDAFLDRLANVLRDLDDRRSGLSPQSRAIVPGQAPLDEIDRLLESLELSPDQLGPLSGAARMEQYRRAARRLLAEDDQVDTQFFRRNDFLRRQIRWARLLVRSRREILEAYLALYGQSEARPDGVALATPALVDYDLWLDDVPAQGSEHRCQVEAVSQIYRNAPIPIHGYVGFDPWRAATEGSDSFELVRAAIEDLGFIGVKLYPSMGFRPFANADQTDPFERYDFGSRDTFRRRLDEELARLYTYCAENSVPVLTHAANSFGAGVGYSERSRPTNWLSAIRAFPELRVCLAHLGNFRGDVMWQAAFGAAFGLGDGVYADMSYNDVALAARARNQDPNVTGLRSFVEKFQLARERLLFGTDWLLIGRERHHADYLDKFNKMLELALASDTARRAVMRENALRYLGLAEGSPGWLRLRRYYRMHTLDFAKVRAVVGA